MTLTDPAVVDFARDRWGRPLITPAGGGKPIPYTRASAAAKTVEDTYNLELWARRNVAYGMARDPSLVARVLALGGDPSTWDQGQKAAANKVHEAAAAVALAHRAAEIGTAVHRMTELADRGEPLHAGPYEADVNAYVAALIDAGYVVDPAYIECRLVCDELQMAGTADRILRRSDGTHIVADLKTGESVDYGGLGWAAQLAAYAHSTLYDVATGQRMPTPRLDRTTGLIVHLPAGKGRCALYEIDLVAGYRAAELANEIRAVRREAKRWIRPATARPAATKADTVDELGRGHDEGDPITDERFLKVQARYVALDPTRRAWAAAIAAEATRAGVGFRLDERRTMRRYWLYAGLIMLAEDGVDDVDFVRALAARATGSDAPLFPTITVGHAVGAMGVTQARRFVDAVDDLRAGRLQIDFSDGAAMRLVDV